jgi:putative hydrolase of the HAD superfamily
MIKSVFFDAIDTLFCPYPNKIEMYRRIIKECVGLDVSTSEMEKIWNELSNENEEQAARKLGDNGFLAWDSFNEKILDSLGYTGNTKKMGEILLYEAWGNEKNFVLFNDVKSALDILKQKNIPSACVSNEMKYLHNFFVPFNINEHFDFVLTSEEAKCEKPNPEIFNSALSKANLNPDEVLFVGDSLVSDYTGALNVGMQPLLIDREDNIQDKNINKISSLVEIGNYI